MALTIIYLDKIYSVVFPSTVDKSGIFRNQIISFHCVLLKLVGYVSPQNHRSVLLIKHLTLSGAQNTHHVVLLAQVVSPGALSILS